jgi:nitroreductase
LLLDVIKAIMDRRSNRAYVSKPLPEQDLHTILEAGRQAPSANNRQPWHFVVVRDPDQKRKVAEACCRQTWMADAGVIIAGLGKPKCPGYQVDVAIAMQNMILAATGLGYGTCWIGAFEQKQVKGILGVPDDLEVVALTPVGVAADRPEARQRQPMSEVASLDRHGQRLV